VAEPPTPAHGESSSGPGSPTDGTASEGNGASPVPPEKHEGASRRRPGGLIGWWISLSNEYRLALIAQIGAFIVALVAAGSGWFVGLQHDSNETSRQKTSFTASQQKDAYTSFLNAATDLAGAIDVESTAIINRYPYDKVDDALTTKTNVETSYTELMHAANLAELFGSHKVRDTANKVVDAAGQSRFHVMLWNESHPQGTNYPTCPEVIQFIKQTKIEDSPQLYADIERFNEAAREDLDIPSLPPSPTPSSDPFPNDVCVNNPPR
jgi:hypothetical protein